MFAHATCKTSIPRSLSFAAIRPFFSRSVSIRMASTLPKLPIFEAIAKHDPSRTAILHSVSQRRFTYGQLLQDVADAKERLSKSVNGKALDGERVAFLVENNYDYVVNLLAILGNHAIAVPLCPTFPASELRYILNQSQTLVLLASPKYGSSAEKVLAEGLDASPILSDVGKTLEGSSKTTSVELEKSDVSKGGMMLYTSGTTSRPKGVVLPQHVLTAQSLSLLRAWDYRPSDHLLHLLPLHHIHGTVNALLTPLFAGSTIEFMFPFNPTAVWTRLAAPFLPNNDKPKAKITFFTAVPTIWSRLLQTFPSLSPEVQKAASEAIKPENLRLNISGSAALPSPVKQAWSDLSSGNALLERFGMTEVGMALSCSLDFRDRVDGSVGWPLPKVEARLVDLESNEIIEVGKEVDENGKERQGEIQLRGPTIFEGYWRNPEATEKEFVKDADGGKPWFKTGDVAVRRNVETAGLSDHDWAKGPLYFIHGRKSADIIKTGGEKVSALEIEREMLSLPEISECAVVGVPSDSWGQKVAAIVVLTEHGKTAGKNGKPYGPMDLRRALREKLVNYKIPQEMKVIESIPRNAMGKINKKMLVQQIFGDDVTS